MDPARQPPTAPTHPALVAICSDPAAVRELLSPGAVTGVDLWDSATAALRGWVDAADLGATPLVHRPVVRLPLDGPAPSLRLAIERLARQLEGSADAVVFASGDGDQPPTAGALRMIAAAGLVPGVDLRTCLRSTMRPSRHLAQVLATFAPLPTGSAIRDRLEHASRPPTGPEWDAIVQATYLETILSSR